MSSTELVFLAGGVDRRAAVVRSRVVVPQRPECSLVVRHRIDPPEICNLTTFPSTLLPPGAVPLGHYGHSREMVTRVGALAGTAGRSEVQSRPKRQRILRH